MTTDTTPLVGIGFPVYNGERFIRQALDTLLAQDYPHFELVISDNGSTDATEAICREYAAADARIRYIRHEQNHGSPWNFKYVVEQTRGEYFMWAAHDDFWAPSYIRKCLAEFQAHPDAVLCCTEINFVDVEGAPSKHYQGHRNLCTLGMNRVQRLHHLICRMGWFALYGLMRRAAVERLSLGLSVSGLDVVLMLELLLMGQYAHVDEPLFSYRITSDCKTIEDYAKDFQDDTILRVPPYTSNAENLLRVIYAPQWGLNVAEKVACTAVLIHTLTCEAPPRPWRGAIIRELFGAPTPMDDRQFAQLFALALSRSVPLYEVVANPLLLAACNFDGNQPQVLPLARSILKQIGFNFQPLWEEKRNEALGHYKEGRYEEAALLYTESIDFIESAGGWFDWANAQARMKRWPEAERGLRRAIYLEPGNAGVAAQLGIVLFEQGRVRESAAWLEQAIPAFSGQTRLSLEQLAQGCRERIAQHRYS